MHKTRAIVLSRREHREADSIATLYTEGFGLVKAVAPGVRKPEAKLRGHLEPLMISEVMFIPTGAGWRLTGAILEDPLPGISGSLAKKRLALGAAALLESIAYTERDVSIWNSLTAFLGFLNQEEVSDGALQRARLWFLVRLLSALGYQPSEDRGADRSDSLRNILIRCEEEPIDSTKDNDTELWDDIGRDIDRAVEEHLGIRLNQPKLRVIS